MARPQRWRTMFERCAVTPGGRLRIILCERHAVARLSTPAQGIAMNTTRTLLGIAAGMGAAASAAGGGPLNTRRPIRCLQDPKAPSAGHVPCRARRASGENRERQCKATLCSRPLLVIVWNGRLGDPMYQCVGRGTSRLPQGLCW